MVWIARIILGILLLIFIRKRPNLSILLGIGLFILYVNDDNDSKGHVKKNINIEQNINKVSQENYLNTLELNSSNSENHKPKKQSYERFSEESIERINYEEFETKKENYKVRVGAVCNDGTISKATGRGACSHHGGVAYWRYE
ncbi:hypothetical protein DFQ03_0472 [Maribacter caenipelagi]|uniref:DUF3761 domain-containing protein n=1 Tax=Maribacter caenipelagi TaxID=1447781 RepID=A0A4R7DE58_9FLAO|nr:hypothetical protein [Maribacter caenipelagi]TDS18762.1 hypothetical protein DFQ03_0472 [Maribacter caenipelagi]